MSAKNHGYKAAVEIFTLFSAFFKCKIYAVFIISNPYYDDTHIKPYKDRLILIWFDLDSKLHEIWTIFL